MTHTQFFAYRYAIASLLRGARGRQMAHPLISEGDLMEAFAQYANHAEIAAAYNSANRGRMSWSDAKVEIHSYVMAAIEKYIEEYYPEPTEQQLADARECDKSHALRDRLSEVA